MFVVLYSSASFSIPRARAIPSRLYKNPAIINLWRGKEACLFFCFFCFFCLSACLPVRPPVRPSVSIPLSVYTYSWSVRRLHVVSRHCSQQPACTSWSWLGQSASWTTSSPSHRHSCPTEGKKQIVTVLTTRTIMWLSESASLSVSQSVRHQWFSQLSETQPVDDWLIDWLIDWAIDWAI